MPGIKRKATAVAPYQSPIKLKKQSTSVAVNRAISTLKKVKSAPKSPVKLLKTASISPRKKSPQKSPKKPLPLPRFPTLKPTKPIDPDALPPKLFYGNTPTTSFTKLKKAPTLLLEGDSTTSATKQLSKKASKKISVKPLSKKNSVKKGSDGDKSSKNSDSEGTITSSGMNRSLRKLASGSLIGKIIKDDGLDALLPADTSLAVYEFSEEMALSPSLNLSKSSNTPAVRQSAYDVANFFVSESPSKDSEDGKDTDHKNSENSSIESDSNGKRDSSSAFDTSLTSVDSDLNPIRSTDSPLKEGENGTKSPKKGLRGGVREIVFSFDTTGSMYSYMEETRDKIKEIVNKLQTDVPGIKLGFLAHGDYYDLQFDRYLIKWINFGASVDEISDFFEDLGTTHGGDPEECYELVLRRVQDPNYVAWTPGSQRCLVMIGDSDPHEPGYTFEGKVNEIDWRQETEKLKEMGVRIYGLQVGYGSDFYRQISKTTGGAHLRLDSATLMPDVITAICLREGNLKLLKHYESEVRSRAKKEGNSVDLELERLFSALKNIEDNKAFKLNKKTPSKSSTKKVQMTTDNKDEKKVAAVKRTLTPFMSAVAKKIKLEKSKLATKENLNSSENEEKLSKVSPKSKTVVAKSLKEVKKSTPSPKAKTLKVPAKTAAVDRGKKVKRLGQSKTSGKKAGTTVKSKTKVKSEVTKKADKGKNKGVDKKEKAKTKAKAEQSSTKKSSSKTPTKAKMPTKAKTPTKAKQVKKVVTKKKAIKTPTKSGTTKKTATTTKAGKKLKATTSKGKTTKTSGNSKSSKVPVKTKNLKSQVKSKVNKVSTKLKAKVKNLKAKAKDNKSSLKDKAKLKSKVSKEKLKTKASLKSKQTSGTASKAASKKAKVGPKSKAAIKPKAAPKAKAVKKKPAPSPKKKVVKSPQTQASRKRPASVKTEKKAKVPKIEKKDNKKEAKASNSTQAKSENGRLFRENVAGSHYATGPLSSLSWTQWSIFVSSTKPKENMDKFISPKGWCSGYCNNELFRSDGIIQAIYEFAVAPPGGTKKYPVFYCATAGSSKINMKECLKNNRMKKEMDRVVKAKGSVYIRRGAFPACNLAKLKETRDYIKENFNYAWGGNDQQYRKTTDIVKDGFIIAKAFK